MTNPTPLSPAAQAVLDAASRKWLDVDDDIPAQVAVAALRAAADQVDYHERLGWTGYGYYTEFQNQILAIATELEGAQ